MKIKMFEIFFSVFQVRHITDDAEIGLMSGNWNRFTQNRDFGTEAMVVTFPSDMRTDLKFMFLSICIYFVSYVSKNFPAIFKIIFKS